MEPLPIMSPIISICFINIPIKNENTMIITGIKVTFLGLLKTDENPRDMPPKQKIIIIEYTKLIVKNWE